MRKSMLMAVLAAALLAPLAAQESSELVTSYQRNFVRASLAVKLSVLKEASSAAGASMAPLYRMALRFVLDNAALLQADIQLRDVAAFAVGALHQAKATEAVEELWSLFQVYRDPAIRVPVLAALGDLAAGNSQMILNLNTFLSNQNAVRQAGMENDVPAIEACAAALGKLGSATSYPVLFTIYSAGYPGTVSKTCLQAMVAITGDFKGFLIEAIRRNTPMEKASALRAALENPSFTEADKAETAEAALDSALSYSAGNKTDLGLIRDLRYRAVRELTNRSWSKASPLAVRNYNLALQEYAADKGTKSALLEAIACLGAMKTNEAAQAMTLQLQLMNAEMEMGKAPDETIILAVVNALGNLGDVVAFDHLLLATFLPYPENIRSAIDVAIKKLKF